jgi:hypothetical protein
MLGGIGAAVGAAGLVAAGIDAAVAAPASSEEAVPRTGTGRAGAVVPVTRTLVLGGPTFRSQHGLPFVVRADGGITTTVAETFVADLGLPSGSQITGITIVLVPGSASPTVKLRRYTLSPPAGSDLQSNTAPGGSNVISFPLSAGGLVLDAQSSYRIEVSLQSADAILYGATVNYVASISGFVTLPAPMRIYDSRNDTAGKLRPGEVRNVSFQQALGGVTPTAAVMNLTITDTESQGALGAENGGYVAVFPANITWPGTSTINWKGTNQNLANTVITGLDNTDTLSVLGGVNRTNFVIDLIGYLV